MSRGFSQRGADGITRHYNSQRNGYGGYNHYDNRGNKRKSSWW